MQTATWASALDQDYVPELRSSLPGNAHHQQVSEC